MIIILKRDLSTQKYDRSKIFNCLNKVYNDGLSKSVPADVMSNFLKDVIEVYENLNQNDYNITINVENIQDNIAKFLQKHDVQAADAFIAKREERSKARENNSKLFKAIKSKLLANNVENQNANLDEQSFSGRIGEAASEMCCDWALKNSMSKKSAKLHKDMMIYQHDLNHYTVGAHNCLSLPLDDVLEKGIKTRQTDIRSAASLNTAFQLTAVNFQIQSLMQFGGISATHIDWTMVPYFRISFFKHYLDGMKYVEHKSDEEIQLFKDNFLKNDTENKRYQKVKRTSIKSDEYEFSEGYDYAYDMTLKELKQAVEGLYHNLNSLQSRSGAQLPFSSINFGTCAEIEGQLIIDAILEAQMNGTGPDHKTAIFPCAIFQYSKEINGRPGTPNYALYRKALKSCSKRIYPNFVNYDWSAQVTGQKYDRDQKEIAVNYLLNNEHKTYEALVKYFSSHLDEAYNLSLSISKEGELEVVSWDVQKPFEISSTMGCRTYNSYDVNCDSEFWIKLFNYIAENNKLPRWKMWSANQKDGRGNICPVTIILPMVAQVTKETLLKKDAEVSKEKLVGTFMSALDEKIDEAVEMLVERYKLICSQKESSAKFMWQNDTMFGYDGEDLTSAYKHGTLAVGQLGLAETLQILIGTDQTTEEGVTLAKQIEQMFYDKCKKYKANTKLNFGVYYTPAENLCYKALKRFREKYGVIPNVSDQEFFTNSMHVPVFRNLDCFEKIDVESQLTGYSNAGCITYVELDSGVENNIDAIEKIVNYAMEKDIPYFALNRKLSYCKKCGTNGDFRTCPHCGATGSEIEQLARVTGYLSTDVSNMNPGKQDETNKRVKHTGQCKLNKNFD